jgi:hypothetical protein
MPGPNTPNQVQPKQNIMKAGGSDHIKQYMAIGIGDRAVKVATHNMLEQCEPGNNAWNTKETSSQYKARLNFLSQEYAKDFNNKTDVLMLQEAPKTQEQAKELFDMIQSKTNVLLGFKYSINAKGQGMMTVYDLSTMGAASEPKMEAGNRVQTTSFNVGGKKVSFKNIHGDFMHTNAHQMTQLMQPTTPGELIIRGGDHNGGVGKFPDLRTAEIEQGATSVSYSTYPASQQTGNFFLGDPKSPQEGKKYDGFAIGGDPAIAAEVNRHANFASAGTFALQGANLVYNSTPLRQALGEPAKDISDTQPIGYRRRADGKIQLEFATGQDAITFAAFAYKAQEEQNEQKITTHQVTMKTVETNASGKPVLKFTEQECLDLLTAKCIIEQEKESLKKIKGQSTGYARGARGIAAPLQTQQRTTTTNKPVPQHIQNKIELTVKTGMTGMIQFQYSSRDDAEAAADYLARAEIAQDRAGNKRAIREEGGKFVLRLTPEEALKAVEEHVNVFDKAVQIINLAKAEIAKRKIHTRFSPAPTPNQRQSWRNNNHSGRGS